MRPLVVLNSLSFCNDEINEYVLKPQKSICFRTTAQQIQAIVMFIQGDVLSWSYSIAAEES